MSENSTRPHSEKGVGPARRPSTRRIGASGLRNKRKWRSMRLKLAAIWRMSVQDVAVKKLRILSKVKKGDRITLEADATNRPDGVYELLDQIGKCRPCTSTTSPRWSLRRRSQWMPTSRPAVTIRITHPNSCSLKYDELDLKLRDMLNASGIEPKEPAEATELAEAAEA